jgi:hypothetical protein
MKESIKSPLPPLHSRQGSAFSKIQNISLLEGALYSLMVGLGETYLVAFALSVGISAAHSSYLAIIPVILGSFLQFLFSQRASRSPHTKQWLMVCTGGQALVLLVLSAIGFSDLRPITAQWLAALASLYWAFGFVAGPLWNTAIVRSIAYAELKSFFFRRNALTHVFSLISLVIACTVLGRSNAGSTHATWLISALLAGAGLARLLSMLSFRWHEFLPIAKEINEDGFGVKWLKRPFVAPVLSFMFLVNLSVNVSGPFFAAYMLKDLHLDFIEYNIILGSAFVSRMLAGYLLNPWVQKFGVKVLLVVGTAGITPLPFFYMITDQFYLLVLVQLLAGFTWGCYELGLTLSLIERVPQAARAKLLTWSNLINACGMAVGVGLASLLIGSGELNRAAYHQLFFISSCLRFVAFLASLRLADVRPKRQLWFRMLGMRSTGAHIMKPILLPEEPEARPPER